MMRRRSVRLHLADNSASSSGTNDWSNGEPPAPPLPLSIALRGLMAEAEAQHDRVDFEAFVDLAESPQLPHRRDGHPQWKRVERSPRFTLLKREDEVLALARLDASVEEVANILGVTTDHAQAATMRGLYREAFIAGSVAYVQRPHANEEDQIFQQLAVKTTNFVHADLWGKNEQWSFAETLRRNPEGGSFTLTQGSLSAHQAESLPARQALKDSKRRVAQLRDVTAAYSVEKLSGTRCVRVAFHALRQPESTSDTRSGDKGAEPVVAPKAARGRLVRLAGGVSELHQLVRSRRFGAQVYADRSAFDIRNPRCTCCTRKLTPFIKFIQRTRCYLCGYYVCVSCSSSEKMETHNGRLASIIVCTRCVKSVIACDYEHMLTVRPGPERVIPDELAQSVCSTSFSTESTASEVSSLSSYAESASSQKLGDLLSQVVDDDSDDVTVGRRRAAFLVLEQLLLVEQQETQAQVDKNAKLLRDANASAQPVEAAKRALDVTKCPKDLAACKFASATSRPYPMIPAILQSEDPTEPPETIVYPIPENEVVRLTAIEHFSLHEIANVAELNVICTLAAAEMGCPHSVVTLVEREVVTLLATNSPENWDVGSGNPREQTFCQHFVMDDQPLLVRHAESDMRFYHIAPVTMRSLRFYAGFTVSVPVVNSGKKGDPDRVVVGALCCLDAKPHEMRRSQYWRLMKLAQAASKILERNAKEYIATHKDVVRDARTQNTTRTYASAAVAC